MHAAPNLTLTSSATFAPGQRVSFKGEAAVFMCPTANTRFVWIKLNGVPKRVPFHALTR